MPTDIIVSEGGYIDLMGQLERGDRMKEVQSSRNRYRYASRLLFSMLLLPSMAAAHDTLDFNAIQGIFRASCGGGACHINQATSGVNLTSYETLMASTGAQYGGPVVVAGSPSRSPLIDKVLMPTPEHGSRMPLGAEPLGELEIDMLLDWVSDGAIRSHLPMRGDADEDESITLTDAIRILQYLFTGGEEIHCRAMADANHDEEVDLTDAIYILNFLFLGGENPGDLSAEEAETCEEDQELSFDSLYENLFATTCAFSSCHSSQARRGDLSLGSLEDARNELVGIAASNDTADDAGMLRVDPGNPDNSFLLRKLIGPGPGEGNRMPANAATPLSDAVTGAVREWILAGAPLEGTIAGVPDLEDDPSPPIDRMPAPPVPENGLQIRLPDFTIGPRAEREVFYYLRNPLQDADFEGDTIHVKRIDIHMRDDSHHFIIYRWSGGRAPRAGFRDIGEDFINFARREFVTASQSSFQGLAFPEGVGLRFNRNVDFDLNSHYLNLNGTEPLIGEVYINFFFAEPGEITTFVEPIFETINTINVPPNATRTVGDTWNVSRETHVYMLSSHMHRHGIEYGAFLTENGQDVRRVYLSRDWDDPVNTFFDTPLVLQPGQGLRHWATHRYNDPPSPNARPLEWGLTSEDEMAILLGYYAEP